MLFRAHSATFTQSTIVRAGMNTAILRNPIAFAHALVAYTFSLVWAIIWAEKYQGILKVEIDGRTSGTLTSCWWSIPRENHQGRSWCRCRAISASAGGWRMGELYLGWSFIEGTYTAGRCNDLLRFGLSTEAAQQWRLEGVAIVNENVVVGAFRAHASEYQRYELAVIFSFDQPLAVWILIRDRTKPVTKPNQEKVKAFSWLTWV